MIVNVGYSKLFEMLWLIYDRHYSGHVVLSRIYFCQSCGFVGFVGVEGAVQYYGPGGDMELVVIGSERLT